MNRNKKKIWGVVMGEPTVKHPSPVEHRHRIGRWIAGDGFSCIRLDDEVPKLPPILFYTRKEAEDFAITCCKNNGYWNYHAKKHSPREP